MQFRTPHDTKAVWKALVKKTLYLSGPEKKRGSPLNDKVMFSKTCKYAIRSVLYLAINSSESRKMSVEELSNELDVPKHFLAKILQQLTKGRLVSSTKGRNGGFYLSSANNASNLLTVIESFDGPGTFTDCVLGLKQCSNENPCPYHSSISKYRNAFLRQVQNESIQETAKRINRQNLRLQDHTE